MPRGGARPNSGGARPGAGRKPRVKQEPRRQFKQAPVDELGVAVRTMVGDLPLRVLYQVCQGGKGIRWPERVMAASQLLDRGWGKARLTVDLKTPKVLTVRVIRVDE